MLLRSTNYNSPIDQWACGGILAELFTLRPLFPGSSEADEIYKICAIMGSPTMRTWPEGIKLAAQMQFRFPQFAPTPFNQIVPNASPEAVQLLQDLLLYDPQQRPTASQSLQYPFFQVNNALPAPMSSAEAVPSTFTRRPVQKSEAELQADERVMAKKAQEELEKGETFTVPEVNILHDTAEPARLHSTYVQAKLQGEAIAGPPSNYPTDQPLYSAKPQAASLMSSIDLDAPIFGGGGDEVEKPKEVKSTHNVARDSYNSLFEDDDFLNDSISKPKVDKKVENTTESLAAFKSVLSSEPSTGSKGGLGAGSYMPSMGSVTSSTLNAPKDLGRPALNPISSSKPADDPFQDSYLSDAPMSR